MTEHILFYYPYASFTNTQLPLLKVAALYFDKLIILDPVGASSDTVGADHIARDAVRQLKDAGLLEIVSPATVLAKYEKTIAAAIRRDMQDHEFLNLCETQVRASGKQRWQISLAKVPQDLQTDQAMRYLMGDLSREILRNLDASTRQTDDRVEYDETEIAEIINQAVRLRSLRESTFEVHVFDEYREGYEGDVEYRYAAFPLPLGEAIMMNHALFAGLLHANATPITDDPFHNRAFSLKLRRASQDPVIQKVQVDRARQIKTDLLALTALTDTQLNLPVLDSRLPLNEVLEYRSKFADALRQARDKLGWMARRIEAEPWDEKFSVELEHKTIPDLAKELDEVRKARDAWLKSKRGRLALTATGIAVGAAAATISIFALPLTPVALATAGLGIVSGTAIPGVEWLLDWREGKKSMKENGLHYLLKI